ncbi:hypothetical protein [Actinokineospora xionganensis]|uniref:Uncharacterized protein n=1 Tax=Actinokineospora xionganensis TaxID=2684470 RepID=A0ABR7KZN6_9PSEU|nr:hypothetical protein [Actinokineospora xionganensis]MBC6445893.1 hypothetical protein [Actinokineospora xionganensis]
MALLSRSRRAVAAVAALRPHRGDHRRLSVRCPRSHHVAAVYDTSAGAVCIATTGPHAHGSKDFVDAGQRTLRVG